jgi:hypothetical protein
VPIYTIPDRVYPVIPFPDPVDNQDVFEMARWLGIRAEQLSLISNETLSRLFYLADRPSTDTSIFDGDVSGDAGVSYNVDRSDMAFVDYAEVETAYSKIAEPYDTTTGLRIDTLSSGLTLETATAAEIREEGKNLILVDDEFMAFESFTAIGGGVYRLDDVWRGLLDTVPAVHSVNASVYFVLSVDSSFRSMGQRIFDGDETLKIRLLTKNAHRALRPTMAPVEDLQLVSRALLPVRPSWFRMREMDQAGAGTNNPGIVDENMARVVWNRRQRAEIEIDRGDDADDIETGTVYDIDCKVELDTSWTELDGDMNDTKAYPKFETVGHGPAEIRVVAEDDTHEAFQDPIIDFILARYRQLLLNPTFNNDNGSGGLDHWDTKAGAPAITSNNPLDVYGYSVGNVTGSWTLNQKVWIDKFFPVGLQARLRFYACGSDPTDSTIITLAALDSSNVVQGSVNTGAISPTTTWTSHNLLLTLPATTAKLEITITSTQGATFNEQQFDEFDLRIGDFTPQQLLNPQFNVNVASWTPVSGTWAVSTPAFEGANAVRCTTSGSHELYQEVLLPVGYKDTGTAWLKGWIANITSVDDTGELVMEARNAGGVLDSITTGVLSYAANSKWRDSDLYLDLPDGTDRIRVRFLVVNPGSASVHLDDVQLVMFKNLHPDVHDDTMDFSEPTQQTWPDTARGWTDLAAPPPYAIWLFGESLGTEFADSLNTNSDNLFHLLKIGTPDLAETLAGFYDGTNLVNKLCFETEDGQQQGGEIHELSKLSIDGENSFVALLVFRAHDAVGGYQPLMGSMDGQGWTVGMNSTGQVRATVTSDSPITVNYDLTEDYGGAVPHYIAFQYNATTGKFRVWSDRQQSVSTTSIPSGDCTNLSKVVIGGGPVGNSLSAQFAYGVLWRGSNAKDLVPSDTDAWWNHARDPSNFIDSYDPKDIVAGDVDSDSDGIVVGRFSQEQIALFRNTGLTANKGIIMHQAQTNLVDPDPNSSSWVEEGSPSVTKRFGVDAERWHRSVKVSTDNVDAYRPPAITAASGNIAVVWYAKGDSPHNARLVLWNTLKTVSVVHDYAVTTAWQRFEHVFAWGGSTAAFELWFHGSDDGTKRIIELSTPLGVYFGKNYVPFVIHPRTAALAAATGSLNNVLPDEFQEEGEISITGICEQNSPGVGTPIIDIHNGTNNNDRRFLSVTGAYYFLFTHYDGVGGSQADSLAAAWDSEWVARGRWNIGGMLEDRTKFSGAHYNTTDNYGHVATFSTTTVILDEIDLGALGALISEVRITSRELTR